MKFRTVASIAALAVVSACIGFGLGVHSVSPGSPLPLNTQFVQAATRGDVNEMDRLLKLGADVNGTQMPSGGFTALDRASDRGYAKVVHWLLAHGADPKRGVDGGRLALSAAEHHLAQTAEVRTLLQNHLSSEVSGFSVPR